MRRIEFVGQRVWASRRQVGVVALAAALLVPGGAVRGATSEAVDHTSLRVCADPHNLPFSNEAGEGYENKIAEMLAKDLQVPVKYTFFPQATGFIRQTIQARRCDLIIGISLGYELIQNTNPYYRSTYALVVRTDSGLSANSLKDPALKGLRLGVVAGTPPADLLAKYGLLGWTRPYHLLVDTRFNNPGMTMVEDVAAGEIDVGILWGPIAGYYAKRHNLSLTVLPLLSEAGETKMDYRITMGVRFNEPDWKHKINALIEKHQAEINEILLEYGVPLLDEQGRPITH